MNGTIEFPEEARPMQGPKQGLGDSIADLLDQVLEAERPALDTTEPMVIKSVRISVSTLRQLEAEAVERGIGVTVLMRMLIESGIRTRDAHQGYVRLNDAIALLVSLSLEKPFDAEIGDGGERRL